IDQALIDLAGKMEAGQDLKMQLISSIAYPAFMMLVAMAVVIFMLTYVLPGLGQIFDQMHLSIPWPTRVLMCIGHLLRDYWLGFAAGGLGLIVGLLAFCSTQHGRQAFDQWLISMPVVGRLVMKAQLAQMAITLSSLLGAGLPLPRALQMSADTLTNSRIKRAWDLVAHQVYEGQPLAAAVRNVGLFPPLFYHILAIAEDTGTFEGGLTELAEMYRRDLQIASRLAVSLLEPVILLIMGVIVGWIVLAVLLPVFGLNQGLG
ncbi:MAG: type II secretion system F family protein, partial [Sedimentisphaerales bacterium]|nr:type II secretion system F family protein [Sedimentisphaerales bacterium]